MARQKRNKKKRIKPIEISSTWRYIMPLKLKETDLVANFINCTKTFSGKEETDVRGLRYKKSAQIEITSSRGTLVNNEAISKDTKN